ncbi:uncharacterized protein LOC125209485 [Salvia hispanica]|uniref:uncharacterized protein LOC125209485 n=1 Tax=Salvia hispanica TaxID=49212 RepID=UPI00200997E9|nr:uncharacterized protein LOC125209485 [Salvia hispanica]
MTDKTELERLEVMVKMLMDEREAEKAAREAQEKKDTQIVPVMHIQTEDVNRYLLKFVEIANNLKLYNVQDDAIRVRLFPFSLIDSAKELFECMPTKRVSTWKDMVAAFLDKYYPSGTILKLKSEIFRFMQGHDEPLHEAFARFKALLRKCPNHGANGGFLRKTGLDAMPVIEEFATNSMGWSKERHNSRRVAAIEKAEESSFAKEWPSSNHQTRHSYPSYGRCQLRATRAAPTDPYNNNYRPNQGDGFNVSNGGVVELIKKEEKYDQGIMKILEMLVQDRKTHGTKIRVVEASLNNLEQGISTIATAVSNIQTQMDQVHKKIEEDKAKRSATEEAEAPAKQELVRHNGIVLPFQPSKQFKLEEQFKHFLNMFCKVHTNIPLVESLQEIPRCSIGEGKVNKALCDLGASINLMPLKYYEKLNIGPLKTSDVIIRYFLATCKALIDVGRGEITIRHNYNRSTYKIESEMFKYEEAQQAKMERECRVVMMTDTSMPFRPLEGEDSSNPSIFVVHTLPQEKPKKKKKDKKKPPTLAGPEVYVIKN